MDIKNLGSPPLTWATPRPDDKERVHDRRLPLDQPNLTRAFMACPPDIQASAEAATAEPVAVSPVFPEFLTSVNAPKKASVSRANS